MGFEPVRVKLKDGTCLTIRALCPDDTRPLAAMHERLSEHSLLMRYLSAARRPIIEQITRMCDIDFASRMALIAVPAQLQPEQIVAVAGYVAPDRNTPHCAELGIVVEDSYQHRGLGSLLLLHLVRYAQAHGMCELTADISYENHAILSFIRQTSLPHRASLWDGLIHISIGITQDLTSLEKDVGPHGAVVAPLKPGHK